MPKIKVKEYERAVVKEVTRDEFIKLYGQAEYDKLVKTGEASGPAGGDVADRYFTAELARKWLCKLEYVVTARDEKEARKAAEYVLMHDGLAKLAIEENTYVE